MDTFALVEFECDKTLATLSCKEIDIPKGVKLEPGLTCIANWRKPGSKKNSRYSVQIIQMSGELEFN